MVYPKITVMWEYTYKYTQWMGQRWYSHYSEQHYFLVPCENWIIMMLQVPLYIYSTHHMYVCCVTCPRRGPNWRDLRELPGLWKDLAMLLAASTMEKSTPNCWSLGGGIRMAILSKMHGSWMWTLGGGWRWVVMNVRLVQLTESVVQTRSKSCYVDSSCCRTTKATNCRILHVYTNFQHDVRISWNFSSTPLPGVQVA